MKKIFEVAGSLEMLKYGGGGLCPDCEEFSHLR